MYVTRVPSTSSGPSLNGERRLRRTGSAPARCSIAARCWPSAAARAPARLQRPPAQREGCRAARGPSCLRTSESETWHQLSSNQGALSLHETPSRRRMHHDDGASSSGARATLTPGGGRGSQIHRERVRKRIVGKAASGAGIICDDTIWRAGAHATQLSSYDRDCHA